MANREVNLTKRIQTSHGWRYCRVLLSANGRVKPDVVFVNGKEERHPEGAYYLEWRDGSNRIRLSVGKDAADASARRLRKESELNALNNGVTVLAEDSQNGHGILLADAIRNFLDEKRLQRKKKTHVDYEAALRYFRQSCTKQYLADITRKDLLAFSVYCRDELELSPRTVFNKFARVVAFLRQNKMNVHENGDAPKFVEQEPEVYEREDLDQFFAACNAQERLWFEFFLMTGMREQEVMHCSWDGINFTRSTITVRRNLRYGFSPKNYKEREIPIPTKLVKELKALKAKSDKTCGLVFPTAGCRPKLNFLDDLKACAERAKLNKEDFWLHKFRATFATWSLWAGVDLRTVQQWLGHSDMESTMRYLKPSRSQQVREKVNEIFA
jgi:integrase/recombinase XerD